MFILFGASFSTSVTKLYPIQNRDVIRTTTKSKMELFVTKVNGFQPLTSVTKSSTLDFAVVLDSLCEGSSFV